MKYDLTKGLDFLVGEHVGHFTNGISEEALIIRRTRIRALFGNRDLYMEMERSCVNLAIFVDKHKQINEAEATRRVSWRRKVNLGRLPFSPLRWSS